MDLDENGCLTQRSQLELLREIANGWARDRLSRLEFAGGGVGTSLIVLRAGTEPTWDARELEVPAAVQARTGTSPRMSRAIALSQLIPVQSIMRVLRDKQASAAALIAPLPTAMIALQIADFEHEQSLTARIIQQRDASPTLGKWDFADILWSVRLRQILLGARGSAPAARSSRPTGVAMPAGRSTLQPAGGSRRHHLRELREQLDREPAAAPSWLQ